MDIKKLSELIAESVDEYCKREIPDDPVLSVCCLPLEESARHAAWAYEFVNQQDNDAARVRSENRVYLNFYLWK